MKQKLCKCGCENYTKGGDYCRGHAPQSGFQKEHKINVGRQTWNIGIKGKEYRKHFENEKFPLEGKTKETDERIKKIAKKHSKTLQTKDKIFFKNTKYIVEWRKNNKEAFKQQKIEQWKRQKADKKFMKKFIDGKTGKNNGMYGKDSPNKGKTLKEIYGKKRAKEIIKNNSLKHIGKSHSKETIKKQRIGISKHIKKVGGPGIGLHEIQILNELELGNNIKILKRKTIGGYFVDGIIKNTNLVIEVDESAHYENGGLRQKDLERQKEIEKENYNFIRIKDNFER